MIIRQMQEDDIPELFDIHRRHFEGEFAFPLNDVNRYLSPDKFVVTDDYDKIVTFGVLELSAEAIVITDKSKSTMERYQALQKLLSAFRFTADNNGFRAIHCTVQDENWKKILIRYGFRECKGSYLYYKV